MKVNVGISNHHVHLNDEDYKILFKNHDLTKRNDLTQPGMYACNETVTIKGSKRSIENVRVLGPLRNYTQVEISKTDAYYLGIDPPVRNSGDLSDAALITIIGPYGKLEKKACIIPTRHIHVDKEIRQKYHLENIDPYSNVEV